MACLLAWSGVPCVWRWSPHRVCPLENHNSSLLCDVTQGRDARERQQKAAAADALAAFRALLAETVREPPADGMGPAAWRAAYGRLVKDPQVRKKTWSFASDQAVLKV